MNKLAIAKTAINFAVGASVSKVMNDIIANNTSADDFTDKVEIAIGSAVLGGMVANAAKEHVNTNIDRTVALWDGFRSRKNETAE